MQRITLLYTPALSTLKHSVVKREIENDMWDLR